jgi:hypothetical protein
MTMKITDPTPVMNPWPKQEEQETQVLPNPALQNMEQKVAAIREDNEVVDRLLSIALMDLAAGDVESAQNGILDAQRIVVDNLR